MDKKPNEYLLITDGGPHGLFKVEGRFAIEAEATVDRLVPALPEMVI